MSSTSESKPKLSADELVSLISILQVEMLSVKTRLAESETRNCSLQETIVNLAHNSVCERFLGSVRRDCLDHVVILGERHLEHVLKEYCFNYFNVARPHQGTAQRLPTAQVVKARTDAASVIAVPALGVLHHDYRAAA